MPKRGDAGAKGINVVLSGLNVVLLSFMIARNQRMESFDDAEFDVAIRKAFD